MKKSKNYCRTYFKIVGDNFDPEEITKLLGIEPNDSWKSDDLRKDGNPYGFSLWECGYNDKYHVYTEKQMEKTIAPLTKKIKILKKIREELNVEFYLVIVPELYVDEINPCLAPSMKIIDFCHATRTQIDIDLYLYPKD